jgi:hypothetical protein
MGAAMEEEFVTIREYRTPWEAHVARARLEEDGIACLVEDEDAANAFGSAIDRIAVRLKVAESQRERADEILGGLEEAAAEGEDDAE